MKATALPLILAAGSVWPLGVDAQVFRFADTAVAYSQGTAASAGFTDPDAALGAPNTGHTVGVPGNNNLDGSPAVVSLGQAGSLTLGFSAPVIDQPASAANPFGYDLLVVGNAFQGGATALPGGVPARFQEPGFVEVALDDGGGSPEWFLILPRLLSFDPALRPGASPPLDLAPDAITPPTVGAFGVLEAPGDSGNSVSLFDGVADATPFDGAAFAAIADASQVVLDDPATFAVEGLGGTGIDLSRAVRQDPSDPGTPELDLAGAFQFVSLDAINRIRITDALADDILAGGLGAVTTEVDAVVVLPNLVPEPGFFAVLAVVGSFAVLRGKARFADRER